MTDKKTKVSDQDLEGIIRERLKKDRFHYLILLRRIIDELPEVIPEDKMFELLEPFWEYTKKSKILDWIPPHITVTDDMLTKLGLSKQDLEPFLSPESVDMLFDPAVRNWLKKWQRMYFDESLPDYKRDKAREKIQKVFEKLTFKRQGRKKAIPESLEEQFYKNYFQLDEKCKTIFKKAKNMSLRHRLIKESFPEYADSVINGSDPINSAEKLRNALLALGYSCSQRTIEEYIRKDGVIEIAKLSIKYPNATEISIQGKGKNKEVMIKETDVEDQKEHVIAADFMRSVLRNKYGVDIDDTSNE
ncbi:MAG: hypothetical protein NTU90_02480 [Proteobacteria bacterium]|nr:hypothetical protein [Pseudomonadota bacterium]